MTSELEIKNLKAELIGGKEILTGLNLKVKQGECHVVMGPNGGGKSTLALVVMGHPGYKVTAGNIWLGKQEITNIPSNERAILGLFLGFQYPVEVPGVNFASFLRMAVNEKNKANKKEEFLSPILFRQQLNKEAIKLALKEDMTKRSLNEGFSGGERKKAEILQMAILKPKFAILDEPDSGLDVDALKYIAEIIAEVKKSTGLILITHYQRILKYVKPDFVHILVGGKIVKSGDSLLAAEIDEQGYEKFT